MSSFDEVPFSFVIGISAVLFVLGGALAHATTPAVFEPHAAAAPSSRSNPRPPPASSVTPETRQDAVAIAAEPVWNAIGLCEARYPLDHAARRDCEHAEDEARFTARAMHIDRDVAVLCTRRNPDDWSGYLGCAKAEMTAKQPVAARPEVPAFDIVAKCEKQHPTSNRRQEQCVAEQEDARLEALSRTIDRAVGIKCTGEWPTDWSKFLACVASESNPNTRLR